MVKRRNNAASGRAVACGGRGGKGGRGGRGGRGVGAITSQEQQPIQLKEQHQQPSNLNSDPPSPWAKSRAKKLCQELLLDEDSYVHGMPSTHIYFSNPLFEQYDKSNFASNFNALKNKTKRNKSAILFDQQAFDQERHHFSRNATTYKGEPFWDTSKAKPLIISELKSGIHKGKTPAEIRLTKDEYKEFSKGSWRNYYNIEKRRLREEVFWQAKRNRKGRQQHEKEMEEQD